MSWEIAVAIVLIIVALGFDFTNGFHDSSNSIATSVSTRAIPLKVALVMAALLNFVGAYIGAVTGRCSRPSGPVRWRHQVPKMR